MWAAAALLIGAAGCKNNSGKLSVSAGTARQTADAGADAGTGGPLDLGNGILVDRVRIVVREIELEGQAAAADAGVDAGVDAGTTMLASRAPAMDDKGGHGGDDDGEHHGGDDDGEHEDEDENEVEVGPFLADMTGADLAAGITEVFDTEVPAGTYEEVKIKIHSVTSGSSNSADAGTSTDPGIAAMNGQTVIVDGTIDGTAFSFQTILTAQQKQEGTIVVASDGSTKNITLHVDPTEWFGGTGASRLDPNDPANANAIRKNIKDSLRVFEDDDHDGCDDHGEHGSGHH
jgi:hypothetical protein